MSATRGEGVHLMDAIADELSDQLAHLSFALSVGNGGPHAGKRVHIEIDQPWTPRAELVARCDGRTWRVAIGLEELIGKTPRE
jgi:hypothetical protein